MTDASCVAGVPYLMDYLEGAVSAEIAATLERHVAGCPRCTAFVESYRETPRIMREATAVTLSVDAQRALRRFLNERLSRG